MRTTSKTSRTATEPAIGFNETTGGGDAPKEDKMEKRICEACHTATEDTFLTVGERENICLECASKMANEAKAENREIEITDENGDAWFLCTWCEELFPESELRKEVDLGHLCDHCIEAIHSRGETLTLRY